MNLHKDNDKRDTGYARYYVYSTLSKQLSEWIEDAYEARVNRNNLICNTNQMMKYNKNCNVNVVTH